MGFPVQIYGAAVLPKVLTLAAAISISTLAHSLLCWLLGLFRFLDPNEGLYISSIGSQFASLYGHDDDDEEEEEEEEPTISEQGGNDMSPTSYRTHLDEPDPDVEDDASAYDGNCCVCLGHISPSSGKQLPCCTHILHSACLDAWLHHALMKACPLCRTPTSID